MAYFRGDNYIWRDSDDKVHFWISDGQDYWSETGWADDMDGNLKAEASGVAVQGDVLDAFVVMRFAELLSTGKAEEMVELVAEDVLGGNFGSNALKEIKADLQALIARFNADRAAG